MNGKTPQSDDRNFFSGVCNCCGEAYEAVTLTDDLEGIQFKCKKVLCEGRVTLHVSNGDKPSAPTKPPVTDKKTPRYC